MCFLGCGTLGTAILSGILDSLSNNDTSASSDSPLPPSNHPKNFIACVRSPSSASRIKSALPQSATHLVKVLQNSNLEAIQSSSIILLGCKPYMASEILSTPGTREALSGKLLISILAGVSVSDLETILYSSPSTSTSQISSESRCRIVRAMPNTAAVHRESMTVISTPPPTLPLSDSHLSLLNWIFNSIGQITHLPSNLMDVCTALCGSGPAFCALVLESLADGAVAMGLPRKEANLMAAQTMKGAASLVLNGEHPAIVREKVSTPGGCTIGGLLVLEEGGVRGQVSRAVREATVVAGLLGSGEKGVNGTRR
ncbi:putative pyrroline-5-carboxylate reductase [Phaeomoniella chlamydospora]|uniref:Pyrroline-5-carboxylate reductase n=1 Tax=Phaeomoniella chlamydospora TaxID=158046 RepID=A0A0G2EAV0_PHACM|nr:putative pyrroline-5-carboxylate reductase [Phaeomoniella chlamydospora]